MNYLLGDLILCDVISALASVATSFSNLNAQYRCRGGQSTRGKCNLNVEVSLVGVWDRNRTYIKRTGLCSIQEVEID